MIRVFFSARDTGDVRDGANYCYLILFNLNKKNNLGAILRSAAAFGVRLVMLVGRQGFKASGALDFVLPGKPVSIDLIRYRVLELWYDLCLFGCLFW